MQAGEQSKKLKQDRVGDDSDMPMADGAPVILSCGGDDDGAAAFPVEEIVQYPQPGNAAPVSFAFSPDDATVAFLYSSDGNLNRKVFGFDLLTRKQEVIFSPPDGGLHENNLSAEERLRRERLRERGLGVTRYEWVKSCSKKAKIMVPLPAGVCNLSSPFSFLQIESNIFIGCKFMFLMVWKWMFKTKVCCYLLL